MFSSEKISKILGNKPRAAGFVTKCANFCLMLPPPLNLIVCFVLSKHAKNLFFEYLMAESHQRFRRKLFKKFVVFLFKWKWNSAEIGIGCCSSWKVAFSVWLCGLRGRRHLPRMALYKVTGSNLSKTVFLVIKGTQLVSSEICFHWVGYYA